MFGGGTSRRIAVIWVLIVFSVEQVISRCTGKLTDRVHLVALLETNPSTRCTESFYVNTIAMVSKLTTEYVFKLLNSNKTDLHVPGVTYDLKVEEICNNRSLATRQAALNVPLSIWPVQQEQECPTNSSSDTNNSLLLGFLGPSRSDNAIYVADFLNSTNIPLISPSATLAALSNKTKYHSFFRTVTSDSKQSKALVDIAIEMKWSYALLLYTNDEYGRQGAADVAIEGRKRDLCFSTQLQIDQDPHPTNRSRYYDDIAAAIERDPAQGIIYFGHESAIVAVLHFYLNSLTTKKKVFLMSDAVGTTPNIINTLQRSPPTSHQYTPDILVISPYNNNCDEEELSGYVQQKLKPFETSHQSFRLTRSSRMKSVTEGIQQTLNAVIALLEGFKTVHTQLCGSNVTGMCSNMSDSTMFYPLMLQALQDTPVNITIGEHLTANINFDKNGDIDKDTEEPAYLLSKIKHTSATHHSYEKIGAYFHNNTWSYTHHNVLPVHYDFRCFKNCSHCLPAKPDYVFRKRTSQYIIAFTTQVNDKKDQYQCRTSITLNGFVTMESFYYVVDQIRNLTGIDFSTLFIDTCLANLRTNSIMDEIFQSENKAYLKDTDGKSHPINSTDIVALIGDASSGVSIILQTYLNIHNIPQISYRSTSTWLSDRLRYPHFLRTVPSDDKQARFMIEIVKMNKWEDVGLIYGDTVYGITGADLVKKYARENGICISYLNVTGSDEKDLENLALDFKLKANRFILPRVIIVFAEEMIVKRLFAKIKHVDTNFQVRGNILLGSEGWSNNQDIIAEAEPYALGSLTFSPSDEVYLWTVNGFNHFQSYLRSQKPNNNRDKPLFIQFWQEYFDCFLPNSFFSTSQKLCDVDNQNLADTEVKTRLDYEDVVGKNVAMAGLSVAYALNEAIHVEKMCQKTNSNDSLNCSTLFDTKHGRQRFFDILKKIKIPSTANSKAQTYSPFDKFGNGKVNYKVFNIQQDGGSGRARYRPVYKITEGDITTMETPLHYSSGAPDRDGVAACTLCECFGDTNRRNRSAKEHSNKEESEFLPSLLSDFFEQLRWLKPFLIANIVCLILFIVTGFSLLGVRAFAFWRNRTSEKYRQSGVFHRSRECSTTLSRNRPPVPSPRKSNTPSQDSTDQGYHGSLREVLNSDYTEAHPSDQRLSKESTTATLPKLTASSGYLNTLVSAHSDALEDIQTKPLSFTLDTHDQHIGITDNSIASRPSSSFQISGLLDETRDC